ncbi:TIGR00725 family protein [Rhodanobacter aciditrophus]|uniref:TIGR00725 family protein n=1 Tax=Rhodanobacter aciditrophus TaxID=1623218 RepID=A0ABW4AYK1_9GAMM
MNTLYSIEPKTNHLLCNNNPTLIRLINSDSPLATTLTQCHNHYEILKLIRQSPNEAQMPPVGVIGPKDATDKQYQVAESLGENLATLGLTVICGGRNGVMEAVCKGVFKGKGQSIGLLPGEHWHEANPYLTVPIATNLGAARNSLIAQAAFSLIAVGGGYGTTTEMAYGLHYGKAVFATAEAPHIEGVQYHLNIEEIVEQVVNQLFDQRSFSVPSMP